MNNMQSVKRLAIAFAATLALLVFTSVTASAQVVKTGQPRGPIGFHGEGKVKDFGDGNIGWFGESWGVGYTEAGKGFLHEASWYCTGEISMSKGLTVGAGGLCTVTDADGDKVYLRWEDEKSTPMGQVYNRGTYLQGTGKYAGIQGHYILEGRSTADGNFAARIVGGEYKLP